MKKTWSKIKDRLFMTGLIMAFVIIVFSCFFVSFKVWRIQHPDAPSWTYILR